jgi:TonB family protein
MQNRGYRAPGQRPFASDAEIGRLRRELGEDFTVRSVVLVAGLVVLGGAPAMAQTPPTAEPAKREPVITKPEWLRKPSGDDISNVWPAKAAQKGVGGKAVILCTVNVTGALRDCKVVSETPEGLGFGPAALMLAGSFQMKPRTVDGKPVEGSTVRIPLSFAGGYRASGPTRAGINEPVWIKAPSFADMAAAWPKGAGDIAEGSANLRCTVMTTGYLKDCVRLAQLPVNKGFGDAAMSLAGRFQLFLAPEEAAKVKGGLVNLPFRFLNPNQPVGQARKVPNPRWTVTLRQDKVLALYPDIAADAGVKAGQGVADCLVAADGKLTDCKVARENPADLGFGPAAVAIAGVMQMNPWTDDGRPVDGARIRLPINFTQADEPAAKAKP